MIYTFFICFTAGIGAGLGTVFAGMSAAAVISPMLITFLGLPAYEAVGIALASDVLASAVSAYTYGKNKSRYTKRRGHDDFRAVVHFNRKLFRKSCPEYHDGKLFCIYDIASGN